MNKILRIFLIIFTGIITLFTVCFFVAFIKSPGKAEAIRDSQGKVIPGSISSIEKIRLGGLDQYIITRGNDQSKPVMLFLHGGPGTPELPLLKKSGLTLEENFIMVYWEQRGSGKSFTKDIKKEDISLEKILSDTYELTTYLKKKYQRDKIYLMGHSWGSYVGILAADRHPEDYHAYIGVGQVCNQYESEKLSFDWIKSQAKERGEEKDFAEISSMTFPAKGSEGATWFAFLPAERAFVSKYGGGITREWKNMMPIAKKMLGAYEYTLVDKINYMRGAAMSGEILFPEVLRADLGESLDSLEVPVYVFQGLYDYQTVHSVAKTFMEELKAPRKEFFTFGNSAHSPFVEETEKFNSTMDNLFNNKGTD